MRSLLLKAPRAAAMAVLAAAAPLAAAVKFAPARPMVAQAVTFTVSDSYPIAPERGLIWSFGDGAVVTTYSTTATHVYARAGTFSVRVDYWVRPAAGGVIQRTGQALVTVFAGETLGPRGDFRVSFLRVRFDDGKTYKVVARGTKELTAFADIKTEGTGILHYEWLVDSAPFRQGTRTLSFARPAVIDSGKVPGLPTHVPGLHDVTLRILSPAAEFAAPVIRYYVTAGDAPSAPAPRATVELTAATGLGGGSLFVNSGTVRLPEGEYCLLRGLLRNESGAAVGAGLLRVTVDGRVSDLQLVRNFGPGETRAFLTSIARSADGSPGLPRAVFISFYDITRKAPLLLVAKRVRVT